MCPPTISLAGLPELYATGWQKSSDQGVILGLVDVAPDRFPTVCPLAHTDHKTAVTVGRGIASGNEMIGLED